jgi:hypothetical protein
MRRSLRIRHLIIKVDKLPPSRALAYSLACAGTAPPSVAI